jgi:low temperature requirement protein LtrA
LTRALLPRSIKAPKDSLLRARRDSHLAERCGLFIIIALGESVLVTGATFACLDWAPVSAAAFVVAFIGSIAMWWIYFNIGAERGSRHIAQSKDPGRAARVAYTYLHLLFVGGIILAAVGDELMLAHPLGPVEMNTAICRGRRAGALCRRQSLVQADAHRAMAAVPSHRIRAARPRGAARSRCHAALSLAGALALIVAAAREMRFSPRDHVEA